jgi:hypothetical protein
VALIFWYTQFIEHFYWAITFSICLTLAAIMAEVSRWMNRPMLSR